jgi:sugar phosphate isomerase/epimerase
LALVQLGDARQPPSGEENRCPLGEGIIPLAEIVKRLSAAGYDGFYEVELMGEEFEAADYRDVIARSMCSFQQWIGGSA